MDLHIILVFLLSIGAAVQSKPKPCSGVKQKDGEEQKEDEVSARTFNRISIFRPGLIFRGRPSTTELPQSNDNSPGNVGMLQGSEGVPNGGYGMIHGGSEKQTLPRNRIFGQGVGLRNNSLSQKIGNLINYQTFGILSGNSLNVNRTQQNNSGPSYQVYLPSGLHQITPVGGQPVGGGGDHGNTGGGHLSHGHRPHHHQGGHLSGLLGHHHSHPLHSLHPHSHHGSHGPATQGHGGVVGARPGHHQLHGGLLGANLLSGGGAGLLHGKPGGLGGIGFIHGGLGGGGQNSASIIGHRPLTHGALGLIHGSHGNQGLTSEGNHVVQPQQSHGGLLGLLQNGLGAQGVFVGGVGGNNHITSGSGLGSSNIFGQHGVLSLIHGSNSGTQGGHFQTVSGSELKPGHVYLHLGAIGEQTGGTVDNGLHSVGGSSIGLGQVYGHGGRPVVTQGVQSQIVGTGSNYQTVGTVDNSFQSVGGSSIGSGQVYGHGGQPVFTQSGQGVQSQIVGTGSNYQTGGTVDNSFQSVGGSSIGSGQVYGHGGQPVFTQSVQGQIYGTEGNYYQTSGTVDNGFQSVGGSSIGSGQEYGHGGRPVVTQSVQGQIVGTDSNYQTGGTVDSGFQSVGGSSIGSGQVYGNGGRPVFTVSGHGVHSQIVGTSNSQTGGTVDSGFQSISGSSIGSGQVYGHGARPVFTQSGQGVQGQIVGTGSSYQTGGASTSQSGQYQSQHNLHQGALSQGGAAIITSNTGGHGVSPGQQSYQGFIYETQWSPPPAVNTAGSSYATGTVGSSSANSNIYNQVNQGSDNFVSGTNVQSLYGNQNIYEGNKHQHTTSQATNGNYYNSDKIPTTTDNVGVYGFSQGTHPVGLYNQTVGQGHISGGSLTQHSHQSSSSSSFGSNSSSQAQESSSQQSYYSGGNLVGVNSGDTSTSAVHKQPSNINHVGGEQSSHLNHLNSNSQGQNNYVSGTNTFHNGAGASGQYMGTYGSAAFSGSYPQENYNTNEQKQGNLPHGSFIYVIQQAPLADEESYIGENQGSVSGSIAGSGTITGATSSMYDNNLGGTSSSASGDSGSSISTSHNYSGPNSSLAASQMKYGGTSSSSALQSGSHGSTSVQSLSTSGTGSTAGSLSSSHSIGSVGSSGSTGSSYNTQHSRPTLSSAAAQGSSSNATQQHGSTNEAVVSGNLGSASGSSTSGNSFSNVNKEISDSQGVTSSDSNLNGWDSFQSGASVGSSTGGVLSTQTSSQGQYASGGSVSSSSQTASSTDKESTLNTSGSNSRPTKPTSSSLSTNHVQLSGMGQHTSSSPSNYETSGTSVNVANTAGTQGSMTSTQANASGSYGLSGTRDTSSSIITSKNNASSYNGISFGQTEHTGTSQTAIKRPTNEGEQQSCCSTISNAQQHHTSGSSPSSGILVGGESGYTSSNSAYSSNYGNNQLSTGNTAAAASSPSHFTASGNSEHSSAHGSTLNGGSGQFSTTAGGQGSYITSSTAVNNNEGLDTGTHIMTNQQEGSYVQGSASSSGQYNDKGSSLQAGNSRPNNEQGSSSFGTMYQSSGSGSSQLSGAEGVSFIATNNNPQPNTVSTFPQTASNAHSVESSGSQMYAISSNTGGHVSGSEEHGNQVSEFAVHSDRNDQLTGLSSEESQGSGSIGTLGINSQHSLNSAHTGSSSASALQSSSAHVESNPEMFGGFNNEHVGSGAGGQISNQHSNFNSNNIHFGMTSSTSGESGSYELVNDNQDKHMLSTGSLATSGSSGSSGIAGGTYPSTTSNTQLSSSAHGDNQLFSSGSSNFKGTGSHLSSTTSQHQGSAGYTPSGNTEITNGHSSMLNTQGHSSVGLTTGSGINKEITGSAHTTSFRYPGQYTFKYGYVHPNNMYSSIAYPPLNTYDPHNIVYSGDINPNTGSNGFYYQYSTAGSPMTLSNTESYNSVPVQTNVQDYLNQPTLPVVSSDPSSHITLLTTIDEEDGSFEDTQTNNGIKGNIQGYFEHSGGGSFEGSVSRPFQGGLSFNGNHELSTGVSGGVSGHLGNVGNFQGFLGNAANKVGGLISGVGQAVGIIRDQGDSQTKGGSQENNIGALQESQGSYRTNNHYQPVLAPFQRQQENLQQEPSLPVYLKENHGSEFDKRFSDETP